MKENKNLLDNIDLGEEYIKLSDYRTWREESGNTKIYLENVSNIDNHIENIKRILKKGYGEEYTVIGWYEQDTTDIYEKIVINTNLPDIKKIIREHTSGCFPQELWDKDKKWLKDEVMIGIWEDVDVFSDYWKDYKNRYGINGLDLLEVFMDYSDYLWKIKGEDNKDITDLNTRDNFIKWYNHIKENNSGIYLKHSSECYLKDWSYEDCNNIIPRND